MQNYHKHSFFSNAFVTDCTESPKAYVKRALELGHKVISSVEHGYQGNYYDIYDLVQENNAQVEQDFANGVIDECLRKKRTLKFIFGAEAYWVKNRLEEYEETVADAGSEDKVSKRHKDRSNCHIVLLARNEAGRQEINEILSEANDTGFYGQPRVDLKLLLQLNPKNVFVTSACCAFWKYEDIDDIVLRLYWHFGNSFMLEVQNHNTEKQKEINRRILNFHAKHGIDIICGLDSHYIYPEEEEERKNYLDGRGITYNEDEAGWYMDYPDDNEVVRRFREQGVLSDKQIKRAMDNTDILLTFDDITFDKNIKLPSIYPNETQKFKDNKLQEIVWDAWEKEKKHIDPTRYQEYEDGIRYELNAVINTHMADYFLLDHAIIKRGLEKGGVITKTGRGSAVSYYINSLLGFSSIDRFSAPVVLYPDRFMSETRILKAVSLPDIDINVGNQDVFAEAQDEVLTEAYGTPYHSYPMVSYKPLQKSSAFKLYAKSQGMEFETANNITTEIARYEKALKHADVDEKDSIDIHDYVEEEYWTYLDEATKYEKIINSKSPHPCAFLIYPRNIRREIGLIRCNSGAGKNQHSVLTTVIDGMVCEHYKMLKNDLLIVTVWKVINDIFKMAGVKTPSVNELDELIKDDESVWKLYANASTVGVNQIESDFAKDCCKRYKPKSIGELCALVAALRPGFKSSLDTFLDRKKHSTGVKPLDELLSDSMGFMIYQESIMKFLGFCGIPQTETYAIIKKISKKKFTDDEIRELKDELKRGWNEKIGSVSGFDKAWQIVEDSARYSFNASHSLSYAYDSAYCAYCKAHYPYEFYAVMLQINTEKGDKDKISAFRNEMLSVFGIKEGEYKFGLDNRTFTIDKRNKTINPCLSSIKGFNQQTADELYAIRDCGCKSFVDLLLYIRDNTGIGMSKIELLIKIGYFSDFGNIKKLMTLYNAFNAMYDPTKKAFKKQISKKNIDKYYVTEDLVKDNCGKETELTYLLVNMYGILRRLEDSEFADVEDYVKASYQANITGNTAITNMEYKGMTVITSVDDANTPIITSHNLGSGKNVKFKISRKIFSRNPLEIGDVIYVVGYEYKPQQKMINGKWKNVDGEKSLWVTDFNMIYRVQKSK